MIVGLIGPRWAGKGEVARYLAQQEWFESFESFQDLKKAQGLERGWTKGTRLVIRRISKEDAILISKRPYCLVVAVDSPLLTRFRRSERDDLELFQQESDAELYGERGIAEVMTSTRVQILNSGTREQLWAQTKSLQIGDEGHLRPNWDSYFLAIAELLSKRTNCMRKKSATVIVRDTRIVSTGYSGTPSRFLNCIEGGCTKCAAQPSSADPLDQCICLCAEESAILEAGRGRCLGATIYVKHFPCLSCSKKIRQAGIVRVVYLNDVGMDVVAASFLTAANVNVEKHVMIGMLNTFYQGQ
uniref:dCMP deaminase n=1 Tax=Rhodosorus marinus TaxID=101924 RepID=A0A7S3A007_9RHOD|mmetsp:Transcript_39546/g.157066  ORF Transcript_39546/g.157066 Transcript_39546/m.157066 type:complete len:300 (+) Transcript_39546:288-1187(+)